MRTLTSIWKDFCSGSKILTRNRGFVFVTVLILALGIAFTTVIFSLVYSILLDPSLYRNSQRTTSFAIHELTRTNISNRGDYLVQEFAAFRSENHVFEDMAGFHETDVTYDDGKEVREVPGAYVTSNIFEFYGVPTLLGRGLTPHDGEPGAEPVFVMGFKFWKSQFNGDSQVLGKVFVINNRSRTLVGIMPQRFQIGSAQIWLPLSLYAGAEGSTDNGGIGVLLETVGRLKPNVSLQAAEADLDVIAHAIARDNPQLPYPERFTVRAKILKYGVSDGLRRTLYVLFAAVILVLLIACSNVANLLLARTSTRAREMAVRAALGAGRGRLVQQLLVESFILTFASCVAGCGLAYLGLMAVSVLIPPDVVPNQAVVELNPVVLLFALVLAALTTLACGLAPALYAIRGDLQPRLTYSRGGQNRGPREGWLRGGLVVTEVALSIILLISSGLMARSFFALTHVDLGFNPANVLCVRLKLPEGAYDTKQKKQIFFQQLLNRVDGLPGVSAAAETLLMPPLWFMSSDATIAGKQHSDAWQFTGMELCSERYFEVLGLHLLSGRLFSASDVDSGAHVAVVNQTLARQYFNNEDPIGQKIRFEVFDRPWLKDAPKEAYFEIIGVVADYKNDGLQIPPKPQAILPYTIAGFGNSRVLLVRTTADPTMLSSKISQEARALDPSVGIISAESLKHFLSENAYADSQFHMTMLGVFAGIGVLLVLVGVFSVMTYWVSLRTREIGIQMALGAQPGDVIRTVVKQGFRLTVMGIVIGYFVSWATTRFLASLVWGVSVIDPWTFAAVGIAILGVGILACWLPARTASRVDPIVALRYE